MAEAIQIIPKTKQKKGITFCSIIKFSILRVEEIAETGELSFQAFCPLSV